MGEVKKIKVENTEFEVKAIAKNYAYLFLRVTKQAPMKGMTIGEMSKAKELVDYLEKNKNEKEIELTAAAIKDLKNKADNFGWVAYSEELITMSEYLESIA